MKMEHRLQCLELKWVTQKPGCYVTLFIVVTKECQQGPFDSDSYRPSSEEIEKYLKNLKENGQCQGCKSSCATDWSPDGFVNHTIGGAGNSFSPESKVHFMFCANAEIPVLCRRLTNGGRDNRIKI